VGRTKGSDEKKSAENGRDETDSGEINRDNLLSVVVRVHEKANLKYFDEALFSLAVQQYEPLEVVIVGDFSQIVALENCAQLQPWTSEMIWKVVSCEEAAGASSKGSAGSPPAGSAAAAAAGVSGVSVTDNRSAKLNIGIRSSSGRYLAFLDYDDVVYQHCYQSLIDRLSAGTAALAAGGSRMAVRDSVTGFISDKQSQRQIDVSKADLWHENMLSIHSFVIDRRRIIGDVLVDESLERLEDYFFLLKLSQVNEFDFALLSQPVCEYRVASSLASGSASYVAAQTPEEQAKWNHALAAIQDWKSTQSGTIQIAVVDELVRQKRALELELARINAVASESAELAGQMEGWKNSAEELALKCDSLGSELKRRPYAMTRRLMTLGAPLLRVYRKFR
jgi:glycosyltransferase involved in cell wall biosynthesis